MVLVLYGLRLQGFLRQPAHEGDKVISPMLWPLYASPPPGDNRGRLRLKRDGTRWHTGGEVKGKLANGVGSLSPSHRFPLPRNVVYPALLPLMCTPWMPVVELTDAPADLNGLARFVERWNLVSVCAPSRFKCSLLFMLEVEMIPGPQCGQNDQVNEKP